MSNDRSRSSRFRRGGAAIFDQAFASGATFLTSVAVAVRLPLEEHGRFGFAMALLGLLHQFHGATLVEPALMHAQGRFGTDGRAYQSGVWRMHWRLMLVVSLPLLAIVAGAAALGSATLPSLVVLWIGTPALLSLHLARRFEIAQLRPERAAQRSGGFAALTIGGLVAFDAMDQLSSATALVALGAAAFLVLVADVRRLRPTDAPGARYPEMVRAHRDHAGWGVGAAAAAWVPRHGVYVILPVLAGEEGFRVAGLLRTHLLVILPAMLAVAALANLNTSVFARRLAAGEPLGVVPKLAQAVLFAGLYGALVVLVGQPLMAYAGAPSTVVWRVLAAVAGTAYAAGAIVAAALLAQAASKAIFSATAGGAALLALAAYPLLAVDLTLGSFLLVAVGYLTNLALLALALGRLQR